MCWNEEIGQRRGWGCAGADGLEVWHSRNDNDFHGYPSDVGVPVEDDAPVDV